MTKFPFWRVLVTLSLAGTAVVAQAKDLTLAGNLNFDTDVVEIDFSLNNTGGIAIWTDSWKSGLNFDPTVSLFDATGRLLITGDDSPDPATLNPGQGGYDSQIVSSLAAGHYLLSLGASGNDPVGTTFGAGFSLDGSVPIRIADWNQPSYDINKNDQKGTSWRLHVDGIDSATVVNGVSAVPEPGEWALLLVGLVCVTAFVGGRYKAS